MTVRRWTTGILMALLAVVALTGPVQAGTETGFDDVSDESVFAVPVTWLRTAGITTGCNPPANTSFCPGDTVTRGQMAALLARVLDLAPAPGGTFIDTFGSVFEEDINRIAAAQITRGCNPPANDTFCPNEPVTREQMAAFLVRGFGLTTANNQNFFVDIQNSVFLGDINALAAAEITLGCNPPDNKKFCPDDPVSREQMAAFIWRAKGQPLAQPTVRLVAAGDIGRCDLSTDEATAQLLDQLFANTDGAVAILGDAVYPDGSPQQYQDCYEPGWGRHKSRTKPAPGNHDYNTTGAAGYFGYFGSPAGDPSKGWYTYTLGSWQVVVLNSNCGKIGGCGADSDQEQWLRATLAANTKICTIVYMHHPRFSSGMHGDDDGLSYLWQAFEEGGVDIALAGHDHNYERFAPLTASGVIAASNGVRSFVVGTGGTNLRPAKASRHGSEIIIDDAHGVLVLDLDDTGYAWQFVDTSAAVRDSGTGSCS